MKTAETAKRRGRSDRCVGKNNIRRPPASVAKPNAPDAGGMTDLVMMTGRAYEKRRVEWHGAYFAEELVLVGAPAES